MVSEICEYLRKFKAHLLMIFTQMCYAILFFVTEAAYNEGLSPFVYITYRDFVAAVFVSPFAYFLEKKTRPKMTWKLFLEISLLSLLGLEHLDAKSTKGIAKILGTIISLTGVTIMTLYKGAVIKRLWHGLGLLHIHGGTMHESWLKGSLLAVASCLSFSIGFTMLSMTLKRYPAQLSLTAWMSLLGGIQSAIFTASVKHKSVEWIVEFDVKFWCIIYGGLVISGLTAYLTLWCTEERGPVFVTIFNPLSTLMVAFLAYFVFGEILYIGSIIGGVIVIIGLHKFPVAEYQKMRIRDLRPIRMQEWLNKGTGAAFCCSLFLFLIILSTWVSTSRSPEIKLEMLYIPALNKVLNSSSDTNLTLDVAFFNYGTYVYYDPINVTFYDNPNQNHSIANFIIPRFSQDEADDDDGPDVVHKGGTMNTTGLDVLTAVKEIMTNGFKVFRVDLVVSARYKVFFFWKTERHQYNKRFNVKIGDTGDAANIGNFLGIIGILMLNLSVASFLSSD
ncbi:hypothetical protein LUZ60_006022 [Juncus effusus]|nr:hypothetical protein LUZ60_006022 [Juncus effusus]